MLYDVKICSLSEQFYMDYPASRYPEISRKANRPYTCLLLDCHDAYLICIPFRSSIKHKEAFLFSGTNRSKKTRSGLDYSKTVLIKKTSYISPSNTVVDADEYRMVMLNIEKITAAIHKYIFGYVSHITGVKPMHEREFQRKYGFSTLPYFHDILKIGAYGSCE